MAPFLSFRHRLLLAGYGLLWTLALPFLFFSRKTGPGLKKRKQQQRTPRPVDVWIQSASSGEASLTASIISAWPPEKPVKILATTNTPQGMDILKPIQPLGNLELILQFCPLDTVGSVDTFLHTHTPKLVVLLETELWPGILTACQKRQIPVLILNGRLTSPSLARYLITPCFWQSLAPQMIKALNTAEAQRFKLLFPAQNPGVIPNIKFDRCSPDRPVDEAHNPLAGMFKPQDRLIVMGSIRRQEELELIEVISKLMRERPNSILALFPRHLDRIRSWTQLLDRKELNWSLRSAIQGQVEQGTVVLWDKFGELIPAYSLAGCAFVGGSLARLGGQNFLEPLSQGIIPCIGPFWSNFSWVGREILELGLVKQVNRAEELPSCLLQSMHNPWPREEVRAKFSEYLRDRQGGTQASIETILDWLDPGNTL